MIKIEKSTEVEGAWLITWEFHGATDEGLKLREFGINNKIIDIIKSQRNFSYVLRHTEKIYKIFRASNPEKIYLAKSSSREKDFILHPYHTIYQAREYSELMKVTDKKGVGSKETIDALNKWNKICKSAYISIGYNPSIFARKVRDLKSLNDSDGREIIEWKEYLRDGSLKKQIHRIEHD